MPMKMPFCGALLGCNFFLGNVELHLRFGVSWRPDLMSILVASKHSLNCRDQVKTRLYEVRDEVEAFVRIGHSEWD